MRNLVSIIIPIGCLVAGILWARPVKDAAIEARISELISQMTIEEKIGQMSQRHYHGGVARWRQAIAEGRVGSFLNVEGLEEKNALQKIAVQESRLGIPLLFGRDVIHGYRTVLPIPIAMASSFNPELIERGARMAAVEASAEGHHWTFAPMIDITRDPRWGRIAETLGEDPLLTSILGAAMVRGFQGPNLSDPGTLAACAKHYVGYGAAEGGRDYNTTWIHERELRDVYLPPFRAAVEAGVATVMSAFNDLNGIPATGNAFTLTQVLRKEWGFDGFVVSDWESMIEMINHGFCEDEDEVAYKSITAGVDMEMVSGAYERRLKWLVEAGKIPEDLIDQRVANILRVKFRKGLFDRPFEDGKARDRILSQAHLEITREAAQQSAILLKNEKNRLPLSPGQTVAVIGPLADSPIDQMGTWTMDGKAEAVVTPLRAFRELLGKERVRYAAGLKTSRDVSKAGFPEAIRAAKSADVVILFVGEEQILTGEAHCRAFLNLPGAQTELVQQIAKTGKPIVLVFMAGRPLTFHEEEPLADAILWAWHNGTMGGPALADLLFGKVSPSGKLPVTFPRTVGQIPLYYAHRNTGRPPTPNEKGIPLGTPLDPQGYTSKYLDVEWTPAYPFGFGLSYTTFSYQNLSLSSDTMKKDGSIVATIEIQNTGKRESTEIVQLYIRDRFASVTRPVKELKGFQRMALKPGEKKTVRFELKAADCGFHGLDLTYTVEPGPFDLWIGPNSAEGLHTTFHIVE